MTSLYRDRITEKEFDELFDVAHGLWYKQKKRRDRCVEQLETIGVKALGPILYVVECDAAQDEESQEDYDNFNQACLEAVKRIGKPALPILEKCIEEDDANICVNAFAQEAVFEVPGLDEKERKKVCKHRECMKQEIEGETIYTCLICEKVMKEGEWG